MTMECGYVLANSFVSNYGERLREVMEEVVKIGETLEQSAFQLAEMTSEVVKLHTEVR